MDLRIGKAQLSGAIGWREAARLTRQSLVHAAGCTERHYRPSCFDLEGLKYWRDWYRGPRVSVPRSLRSLFGRYIGPTEPGKPGRRRKRRSAKQIRQRKQRNQS